MTHFHYFSIVSLICLLTQINATFSEQVNDNGQDDYEYESADYDYDQDERETGQNFNAFSDAELSAALSRLSTRELNRLSKLMATEDATDHRKNKRECQQQPCSDSAAVSNFAGDERDQVASFRGWFRKRKPTTTTTTTTTVQPTKAKVTKRKPTRTKKVTKPRKKPPPRKLTHQIADDVKLYGNDWSAKAVLDRNVHNRIDFLKSKLRNCKWFHMPNFSNNF